MEQGDSQSSPASVQSKRSGPASTVADTQAVQKVHYLRYVIVRAKVFCNNSIDGETFAEGIPDKLFDTDIVAALGHTLSDEHPDIRSGVAHIFTAAVVKGTLRRSRGCSC